MIIIAKYNAPNGLCSKDKEAFAIANKLGAELQGSGMWLEEPFERDLEWKIERQAGLKMVIALRQAGLKVTYD